MDATMMFKIDGAAVPGHCAPLSGDRKSPQASVLWSDAYAMNRCLGEQQMLVGTFAGISSAFRCSVVITATGITRRGLVNYQENSRLRFSLLSADPTHLSLLSICKPQVILCSNQIAGIFDASYFEQFLRIWLKRLTIFS
jgi:hypothetical protein